MGRRRNILINGVIFILIIVASGCSTEQESEPSPGSSVSNKGDGNKAEEIRKVHQDLKDLLKEVEEALKSREWSLARKLIESGLTGATNGGSDFESERGSFLLLRGNLARDMGEEIPSRRDYADAMAVFRVKKNEVGRFKVHLAEAQLEETLGAYAAAARQLGEAEALLGNVDDLALKASFLFRTGKLAYRQVRLDEAYTALFDAYKIYCDLKDQEAKAETLLQISVVEDSKGDSSQSKRSLEKSLKLFRELKNKDGEVRALHMLASLAARDNQYRRARALLEDVEKLYEDLGRSSDAMKVRQRLNALPEGGKKN